MHKYQPRIHIIKKKDTSDTVAVDVERPSSLKKTFLFPDTVFTTVTAYQNQQVSPLLSFNNSSILPSSNALVKKVPIIVLARDSYHWVIDLLNTEKRCSFMSTGYLHSYLESFLNDLRPPVWLRHVRTLKMMYVWNIETSAYWNLIIFTEAQNIN